MDILQKLIAYYGDITLTEAIDKIINATYIDVYTDGSSQYINECRSEGIGVFFGDNDPRNVSESIAVQNNNQCEIIACIRALEILGRDNHQYVNVYSDSRLVIDGILGIASVAKFSDLFAKLKLLSAKFVAINWIYVRGHSGIYGNEQADALAKAACL